ncbi:MAG: hypothetical protein WD794_05445 [Mycobacteriales bacterium]
MTEYGFSYDPTITAGRVLFRVRNTGTVVHSLNMLPLTEDIPPIDEQIRGDRRLAVRPFAGFESLRPGADTTFAVDLAPNTRYALLCFEADDEGVSHLLRGMNSEFRTARAGPPPPPPQPPQQRQRHIEPVESRTLTSEFLQVRLPH